MVCTFVLCKGYFSSRLKLTAVTSELGRRREKIHSKYFILRFGHETHKNIAFSYPAHLLDFFHIWTAQYCSFFSSSAADTFFFLMSWEHVSAYPAKAFKLEPQEIKLYQGKSKAVNWISISLNNSARLQTKSFLQNKHVRKCIFHTYYSVISTAKRCS